MNDSDYIKTAKRIYEELNKVSFETSPDVQREEGGAWVTARVWVDDEWVENDK